MRNLGKAFVVLILIAGITGCVTRGRDFSSDLSWIKANQTTQADVANLLGAPYKVGNAGGTPTWTYSYYRLHLFGDDFTKDLKFYWTNDKKVKDYSFTSSFPTDRRQALYLNEKVSPPQQPAR